MPAHKVLLIYPNGTLMNPPPVAMGIFTALLKGAGYKVFLFDTTLYQPTDRRSSDTVKAHNLQVRPTDHAAHGVHLKTSDMGTDLRALLRKNRPDIIALSSLECTYEQARYLLDSLHGVSVPVIAGGVFPTFAPELFLAHPAVSVVVRGEGEEPLLALCRAFVHGKNWRTVPGIAYRHKGKTVMNPLAPPIDLDALPVPDYSLFPRERFLRPMGGKIYRTIPIEMNRGCPFTCAYCNSPAVVRLYRDRKYAFFRKKSLPVIERELHTLIGKHAAEYVYFSSDNFLLMDRDEFDGFIRLYQKIRLPFWIQSRPEAITYDRARRLKAVGCHRLSVGLEHGNASFRRQVLSKTFPNRAMERASDILSRVGIPLTVNNIIGFPDETRDLVFDTIALNRKLAIDSVNCAIFAPFHGTPLRERSVSQGYIDPSFICRPANMYASLSMPQLPQKELYGLQRTFPLYVKMPKRYWGSIRRAETDDRELSRLQRLYRQRYF